MRRALGAGVLVFGLLLCARATGAHDPITTKVTFAREVRAIFAARCVVCHAPGGSAPMPLTTYEEVRPWARAIKEQILTRRMPKWHAARGFGAFENDPTLTPFEQSLLVSWVDGGLPEGTPQGARVALSRTGALPAGVPAEGVTTLTVPPLADVARMPLDPLRAIRGWTFEPGDPLITAAVIGIDGVTVGAWVAGDRLTLLPPGIGFRPGERVRVDVRRRAATDYERLFVPRRSVLTLYTDTAESLRRAWTEQIPCGSPRLGRAGDLLAVRPLLDRSDARLSITRAGAPAIIVGWFRDFDPLYPRAYWLRRPADFAADAQLVSDGPCRVELTLVSQRAEPQATARQ